VNTGVSYQWRPSVSFFLDVANVFNEPQRLYIGYQDRTQRIIHAGTSLTFGVSGRF
jgi:hypothetical protein